MRRRSADAEGSAPPRGAGRERMLGPRKPGSAVRPKAAAAISLGASSRTPANDLPEDLGAGSAILLFGLPPGGVCRAIPVFRDAVSSYLAVSPLPSLLPAVRRSDLCGTVPVLADGGRYPPPCPWEPGLSSCSAKLPAAAQGPSASTLGRQRPASRQNSLPRRDVVRVQGGMPAPKAPDPVRTSVMRKRPWQRRNGHLRTFRRNAVSDA